MLLLHGFPQFWWTWRNQLRLSTAAGYRAVAVDLRGYGGSDKPPRGYDLYTLAADAAGLIRALGETNAVVVGHDWAGWSRGPWPPTSEGGPAAGHRLDGPPAAAACRGAVQPRHRSWGPPSRVRGGYPLVFQVPMLPERRLVRDAGALVGKILKPWSAPGWPQGEIPRAYQRAIRIPRSRTARWNTSAGSAAPASAPTEALRADPAGPGPRTDLAVARRARPAHPPPHRARGRPLRSRAVPVAAAGGAGHYPHEERPEPSTPNCSAGWPTRNRTVDGRRAGRKPARSAAPGGTGIPGRQRTGVGWTSSAAAAPRGAARGRGEHSGRPCGHPGRGGGARRPLPAEGHPFHAHEAEGRWNDPPRTANCGGDWPRSCRPHPRLPGQPRGAATLSAGGRALRQYGPTTQESTRLVAAVAEDIATRRNETARRRGRAIRALPARGRLVAVLGVRLDGQLGLPRSRRPRPRTR